MTDTIDLSSLFASASFSRQQYEILKRLVRSLEVEMAANGTPINLNSTFVSDVDGAQLASIMSEILMEIRLLREMLQPHL